MILALEETLRKRALEMSECEKRIEGVRQEVTVLQVVCASRTCVRERARAEDVGGSLQERVMCYRGGHKVC